MSNDHDIIVVQFYEDGEKSEVAVEVDNQKKNGYMRYLCWEMENLLVTKEQVAKSKETEVPIQLNEIPHNYVFTLDNGAKKFCIEEINPSNKIEYTKYFLEMRAERILNQMFLTSLNNVARANLN